MIEKMKRYTFLVFHGQYDDFLLRLREAGVLHISERKADDEATERLQEKLLFEAEIGKTIEQARTYLPEGATPLLVVESSDIDESIVGDFADLVAERQRLERQKEQTAQEAERMNPWGNYDTALLDKLAQAGHEVHCIICPKDKFDNTIANAILVGSDAKSDYYIILGALPQSDNGEPLFAGEEVKLNARNHAQLLTDVDNINGLLVANRAKLEQYAIANLCRLETLKHEVHLAAQWDRAHLDTEAVAQGSVMLLEGYCPANAEDALNTMLEQTGVYYQAEDPAVGEPIPIKLRNNFFSRLFEPITELYSLPNYSEIDPTALFAPFFMLFFGLCMGDAGYGLLILAASIFLLKKKPDMKSIGWLGVFLGGATIFAGCLTGVVFGINLDSVSWPWLKNVKHLFLTSNNYQAQLGYDPMMLLAIALGVIQILFAMCINVTKITIQHGFKYAVSEASWVIALVDGIIILVAHYMLHLAWDAPAMYAMYAIAGICALGIFFYNSPGKNPLVNVGSGLWGTYNMASGLLGDVLSYIRLFALGLAGGILGNVFNQLAMQLGGAMPVWIGWFFALLILLLGHGLNFLLCIISAIVHPMRLTFVEFYKNAGFEGGGLAYKPFKS